MTGYSLSQSYIALLLVISCYVSKGATAMSCLEASDIQNPPPLLLVLTSFIPAFGDIPWHYEWGWYSCTIYGWTFKSHLFSQFDLLGVSAVTTMTTKRSVSDQSWQQHYSLGIAWLITYIGYIALIGSWCPFSKTTASASPLGPVTSLAVVLKLWILSCRTDLRANQNVVG